MSKKSMIEKLRKSIEMGEIDSEILEILELINSKPEFYTTSSCAGRIVVLEVPEIGDKKNAQFLGKWHREVSFEEVKKALEKGKKGFIFLISQSPIIHVVASDLEHGSKIRNLALMSGFKESCIKSVSKKIVIEIRSSERINVPLGMDKVLVDDEYLRFLVKQANIALKKARVKLKRLKKELECYL